MTDVQRAGIEGETAGAGPRPAQCQRAGSGLDGAGGEIHASRKGQRGHAGSGDGPGLIAADDQRGADADRTRRGLDVDAAAGIARRKRQRLGGAAGDVNRGDEAGSRFELQAIHGQRRVQSGGDGGDARGERGGAEDERIGRDESRRGRYRAGEVVRPVAGAVQGEAFGCREIAEELLAGGEDQVLPTRGIELVGPSRIAGGAQPPIHGRQVESGQSGGEERIRTGGDRAERVEVDLDDTRDSRAEAQADRIIRTGGADVQDEGGPVAELEDTRTAVVSAVIG